MQGWKGVILAIFQKWQNGTFSPLDVFWFFFQPNACIWSAITLLFYHIEPQKMGLLQFCSPVFLGILRIPKQKDFFNSCEVFLMAALTGHGHLDHSKKLPKWHFLTPAWNLKLFWAKCLHMKCYENAILWYYPKFVSGFRPSAYTSE